jgi:hypothetical protein
VRQVRPQKETRLVLYDFDLPELVAIAHKLGIDEKICCREDRLIARKTLPASPQVPPPWRLRVVYNYLQELTRHELIFFLRSLARYRLHSPDVYAPAEQYRRAAWEYCVSACDALLKSQLRDATRICAHVPKRGIPLWRYA